MKVSVFVKSILSKNKYVLMWNAIQSKVYFNSLELHYDGVLSIAEYTQN